MNSDDIFLLYFVGLPLVLPFIIGILILAGFWKDEVSRLVGVFTLKPVLAYPIWFYLTLQIFSDYSYLRQEYGGDIVFLIPLIPAIALTIIIFFMFRDLFKTSQLARLF